MAIAPLESLEFANCPPETAQYLVVMLHGWGANYHDLKPLARMLDLPHCHFLFPNAPFPHFQSPQGRAWYALEREDFQGLPEARDRLFQWLQILPENTGIPPERTAMIGFSQGGAMTLDVGLQFNFAALCSCSGYLHYEPQRRPGDFSPTLLIHGTQDPVVPIQAAHQAKTQLGQVGVPLDYFEFSGGHEIPAIALARISQFLNQHLLQKET
ncbi:MULTISPECIES: alpha/beta hydrolase [unclassified Picosynechococcus]|uniref:alpha/beta hydrolase n=1 Tax=unclassified Picosynechococcus TaxID=3079910 RepID=UPI000810D2B5|nr:MULTISPECIES: serine esterase [unclassified Picosynechococcus]ANV88267.1 serine esterase [Picosynechococcus sp. PCC 7117]ANV91467.1 serine esterase [Picosynechococcus sp. PCC 8807]